MGTKIKRPKPLTSSEKKVKKRDLPMKIFVTSLIIGIIVLSSLCVYLQSDYSNISSISIVGNKHLSNELIMQETMITTEDKFILMNLKKIEDQLLCNELILSVTVTKGNNNKVEITIIEESIIGYKKILGDKYLITADGELIEINKDNEFLTTIYPILSNFDDETILKEVSGKLDGIHENALELISDITITGQFENSTDLVLTMHDGVKVFSNVNSLSSLDYYEDVSTMLTTNKCLYIEEISKNMYSNNDCVQTDYDLIKEGEVAAVSETRDITSKPKENTAPDNATIDQKESLNTNSSLVNGIITRIPGE